MIEIIPATNQPDIKTAVPTSKSYTNRAALIAALAEGKSEIINPLQSDDTKVMIRALKQLGIKIAQKKNKLIIQGAKGVFNISTKQINLENAGTAVRMLTAVLALQNSEYKVQGNSRMNNRPIGDLINALNQLGAEIKSNNNCPPLTIRGPIKGGEVTINGNISSQFLSALLIASPLTNKPTTISVKNKLTSAPYIDMTLETMEKFGVKVRNKSFKTFNIPTQTYKHAKYEVEGDASSATYPLAISAINNSKCTITNIPSTTKQADFRFLNILRKAGCKVTINKNQFTIIGPKELKPLGTIDLNSLPDAAMSVAVICTFAKGKSTLKNIENLRVKETDRLKALATELTKIGVKVKEGKSSLTIFGVPENLHGAEIETYNDHRMAMCFSVVGSKIPGIRIINPDCTAKTYPGYWKDLKKWGIKWKKL